MSLASFLNQNDYKVFGPMDFYYYFNTHHSFPGGKESPVDREHFDWENELLSKDVLIIEVSSTLVHEAGYGFVESALEALGAVPFQPCQPTLHRPNPDGGQQLRSSRSGRTSPPASR